MKVFMKPAPQGKTVKLNKPTNRQRRTKKSKVYVKDGDKVKLVRFTQGKGNEKTMKIKS